MLQHLILRKTVKMRLEKALNNSNSNRILLPKLVSSPGKGKKKK